jgi:hypothetical protein
VVGDLAAVVLAHQVQADVDAGGGAGRGEHVVLVDEQHVRVEATCGYHFRNSGARAQCVVARRPSSIPAAARTKAPVQIDTIRAPGRPRTRARPPPAAGATGVDLRRLSNGGMTTVSAVRKASGPCSTVIEKSALVRTGRPSAVQVTDLVAAVGRAEDPFRDAQVEGVHPVGGEDDDPLHGVRRTPRDRG